MGAICQEPLASLSLALARVGAIRNFVETGTYQGDSLDWAARFFECVWTVEISASYLSSARLRNTQHTNIRYVLGNSALELPNICALLDGPALFWLDAHAGAGFFGPEDDCPLLGELEAVLGSPFEHCMIIDDARAFVAPPPPPFNRQRWPALEDIFSVLLRRPGYHAVIIADALIVVPRRFRNVVAEFCNAVRPTI